MAIQQVVQWPGLATYGSGQPFLSVFDLPPARRPPGGGHVGDWVKWEAAHYSVGGPGAQFWCNTRAGVARVLVQHTCRCRDEKCARMGHTHTRARAHTHACARTHTHTHTHAYTHTLLHRWTAWTAARTLAASARRGAFSSPHTRCLCVCARARARVCARSARIPKIGRCLTMCTLLCPCCPAGPPRASV